MMKGYLGKRAIALAETIILKYFMNCLRNYKKFGDFNGEIEDYFSLSFRTIRMYDKDTLRNAHEQ